MEDRNIKEEDVFEKIKEQIYELHPIRKPRIDSWAYYESRTAKPEMSIDFYFFVDNDDSVKVQIGFMDGCRSFRHSAGNSYLTDIVISEETIVKLISFILINFPYMQSLHKTPNGFEMNFCIGAEHEEEEGIGCSVVDVVFETHPLLYDRFKELFNNYIEYITDNFYAYVSKTPEFNEAYNKWSKKIKGEIITSLSHDELVNFVSLIDDEAMRQLLFSMNNDYFFEICNSFQKNSETAKKKMLELKDSSLDTMTGDN